MPDLPALADPFDSLPIPPIDSAIFSDEFPLNNFLSFDDEDFDITFDDISLPSDKDDFLNSNFSVSNPDSNEFVSDPGSDRVGLSSNSDTCDHGSNVSGFLNISSPDVSGNDCVQVIHKAASNCVSPENPASSQGSGSDADMNCPSPESGNSIVHQKEVKDESRNNKRKQENEDANSGSRPVKYRMSNGTSAKSEDNSTQLNEDEKKKARLIRNRESAQLSRQRKKHYVEELEEKVRAMHSTIQDLNTRISYMAAENATLRQHMVMGGGGSSGAGGAVCPPPVMYPAHPVMAPMGYPWMPCPPYVVKPQGSQVPLVPIPRLKPQQPVSSQKAKKVEEKKVEEKKVEAKKTESKTKTKTKKVASVSVLGLMLSMLFFGVLVPMVDVRFGGMKDGVDSGGSHNLSYNLHNRGRVLMADNHVNGTNMNTGIRSGRGQEQNASEPLVASLYVPRNDKLVKIDGNLIIHSVLASEKAKAHGKKEGMTKKEETGLSVALDLAPAISVPDVGRNNGRHGHMYRTSGERQRALASDKDTKSKAADGKLQQWFREGLAGPMLSSSMCTEVFQFDVSAASASGAIIPATSIVNLTATGHQNSTYIAKGKNRRFLRGLPTTLPASINNATKEQVPSSSSSSNSKQDNPQKNNSVSSMVVSVLVDPREAGDGGDSDGVMGPKSFSRIFVVVLLDSVKYVTYSCMLPLKGASHLVTT